MNAAGANRPGTALTAGRKQTAGAGDPALAVKGATSLICTIVADGF